MKLMRLILCLGTLNVFAYCSTCPVSEITGNYYDVWYEVTKMEDDGTEGTLRYAITQANIRGTEASYISGRKKSSYISFNITGTGERVITLSSDLPKIVAEVFVDGTSQPGYGVNGPVITITSLNRVAGSGFDLFSNATTGDPSSRYSIIKGLKIKTFKLYGIRIASNSSNAATLNAPFIIKDNVIFDIGGVVYEFGGYGIGVFGVEIYGNNAVFVNNILGADKSYTTGSVASSGLKLKGGIILMDRKYEDWAKVPVKNASYIGRVPDSQVFTPNYVSAPNQFYNADYGVHLRTYQDMNMFGVYVLNNVFNEISIKNINLVNSFYQHPSNYTYYANKNKSQPSGITISSSSISGTAGPNDLVQIYTSDNSGIDAEVLIGTVQANGSGAWSIVPNWASIGIPYINVPKITLSATSVSDGTSEFISVSNPGYCPPITANAGIDQSVCAAPITLSANTSAFGVGVWSIVSGSGSFDNINSPTAVFTLSPNSTAALRWTISYNSGFSCAPVYDEITVTNSSSDVVLSFTHLPDFICYSTNSIALTGNNTNALFKIDNVVKTEFTPSAEGSGPHTITYSYSPTCYIEQDVTVGLKPVYIDRVLSVSAITLSDNWPLAAEYSLNKTSLQNLDVISSGSKGVWRAEESYAYEDKRQFTSTNPELRVDGIFNDMQLFNYASAGNAECNVNWRKVNTVTKYNFESSELENRDILGIHSSALYGYDGKLAIAVASNSRSDEFAFEGFEEYSAGQLIKPENLSMGNFTFATTSVINSDFSSKTIEVDVIKGLYNIVTIDLPYAKASTSISTGTLLKVFGACVNTYNIKDITGEFVVVSVAQEPSNSSYTKVVLTDAGALLPYYWKGKVTVMFNVGATNPLSSAMNLSIQENSVTKKAHTGKKFLKQLQSASDNAKFDQVRMSVVPGESIMFSAWVSADNVNVPTLDQIGGAGQWRGAGIQFFNSNNILVGTTEIKPSGNIIEGWQKVEGKADVPITAVKMRVSLNAWVGTTYWDDIRIFPYKSNMVSYVYNSINYKVEAILDNNNYATLYFYDEEGNLFLTKKETERGIMTIQEAFSHQRHE